MELKFKMNLIYSNRGNSMVFEEIELRHLVKELEKSDDLILFSIKSKIEQVMQESVHKRYTLRTTDWCVENGKKNKGKTKRIKSSIL